MFIWSNESLIDHKNRINHTVKVGFCLVFPLRFLQRKYNCELGNPQEFTETSETSIKNHWTF